MKNSNESNHAINLFTSALAIPSGVGTIAAHKIEVVEENDKNNSPELALHDELLKIKSERKKRDIALRPLFLNIGMAVSLLLAIVAINWKSYDDQELISLGAVKADLDEIIEIPISKQPPPPAVKNEVFLIKEVKDTEIIEDLEISLDVEVTEDAIVEEVEVSIAEVEEVIEEIFVIVEQEPVPQGGFEAFYSYLADKLKYPPSALRLGVTGSVFVQFVVEKDGSITQAQVVKGIGAGCDEEALRVINAAPAWVPGKQRGKAVRVKKIIPVKFVMARN